MPRPRKNGDDAQPGPWAALESGAGSPFDALAVDRSQSIPQQVYQVLREAIIAFRFAPGAILVERQLTEQLGVSRTPIRQAIRQLEDDGLVEIQPHVGTYVSRIHMAQVREGKLVRDSLERAAIREAAPHVTEPDTQRLQDLNDTLARHGERGRHGAFIASDDAFHETLVSLSGYPRVWRLIQAAKSQLDRVRRLASPIPGQPERVVREHGRIIEALATRDPEQAETALKAHLDSAFRVSDQLIADHADYFD